MERVREKSGRGASNSLGIDLCSVTVVRVCVWGSVVRVAGGNSTGLGQLCADWRMRSQRGAK